MGRCQADGPAKCKAWTLVPKGQSNPCCCLKSTVPAPRKDSRFVSGVEDPSSKPQGSGQTMTIKTTNSTLANLEGQPFKYKAGDPLTLRVLVDHSIVEGYAQGGRAVT